MNKKPALKRLLKPRHIAIIGGAAAEETIRQCRRIGFDGDIWPVNPKRETMGGLPCFASIADLPEAPDASFIAVPRETAVQVVADLAARGAGGAVCYSSGFAEAGGEGVELQRKLVEAAGGMAIVGPNCHGLVNYVDGVSLWPDEQGGQRVDEGVAIVLQSGNVGISLTMQDRSLPLSYIVTIGNKADLSFHDYIEALTDDPRVTAIGLYVEGLDDVPAFSRAALGALARGKPIVVFKSGISELGAQATMSHTSSLAGSDELYAALFERLGIPRASSLSELLEALKFLSVNGGIDDARIGSMSCSGGEASMIADVSDRLDIELPALTADSARRLHDVLGDRVNVTNPLDYDVFIWGDGQALTDCFTAMLDNAFDCHILVIDYPRPDLCSLDNWERAERALIEACERTGQRAVIVSTLPENFPPAARERLLAAGIAPMQGLNECLFAIRAAADVGRAAARIERIAVIPVTPAVNADGRMLDEIASKAALAEHGLTVPVGRRCSAADAGAVAAEVGYPVAVKVLSETIAHKSDAGGVYLNVRDDAALASAIESMSGLADQFLVEAMAPEPVAELIVGVKRDPQFGLALVIGAGGILVELVRDSVTLLLPASREDIGNAVGALRVKRLLDGYRGKPAGDRKALVDAIEAIAAYAEANRDTLIELDVNPLFVLPDGQGALAVDALVRRV